MSTSIFSFSVTRPYAEFIAHRTDRYDGEGGKEFRIARWPFQGRFRVQQATLVFAPSRNSIATFRAFWDARQGSYDTFLYMPVLEEFKSVSGESLGTGDGSTTDFALDSKYLDASSVVVYVGGVSQGSGWSLIDNYGTPLIRFTAAPSSGAITADYDRYYPCRFDQDELPAEVRNLASTDANSILRIQSVTWSQDRPGSHLV